MDSGKSENILCSYIRDPKKRENSNKSSTSNTSYMETYVKQAPQKGLKHYCVHYCIFGAKKRYKI